MTEGIKAIVYPVKDLAKAKTLYSGLLGVPPGMDEAYYDGFNVDGLDVGLDPHGHGQGMTGPVGYWQAPGRGGNRDDRGDRGAARRVRTLRVPFESHQCHKEMRFYDQPGQFRRLVPKPHPSPTGSPP